jgi:von Willebrand factor type A domain
MNTTQLLRSALFVIPTLLGVASFAHCSSTVDPGELPDPRIDNTSSGDPACGLAGCPSSGGSGNSSGQNTSSGTIPDFAACKKSSSDGRKAAVHLVFSFDVTGSMCYLPVDGRGIPEFLDDGNGNPVPNPAFASSCTRPDTKWTQVKSGLKNFFEKTQDPDLSVSLITWSARFDQSGATQYCDGSKFNSSLIPATTTLPSTLPGGKLDMVKPGGATPTAGAIAGASKYIEGVKGSLDGGRVVLVLVTDGEPNICPGNVDDLGAAQEAARRGNSGPLNQIAAGSLTASEGAAQTLNRKGTPTYVIGVGSELANLNKIAAAGGTKSAVVISNSNPTQVGKQLLEQLEKIRGEVSGCSIRISAPAEGELDFAKVNLTFETPNGVVAKPYSQDCKDPNGWKYNVAPGGAEKPSRIELCDASCKESKANPSTKIQLVFGCVSKGVN